MLNLSGKEAEAAHTIGQLTFGNPFVPQRIELERAILGDQHIAGRAVWSVDPAVLGDNPNVVAIGRLAEELAEKARQRAMPNQMDPGERDLYEGLVLYVLYYRCEHVLYCEITDPTGAAAFAPIFERFDNDYQHFFGQGAEMLETPAQLFALVFQHRRAFQFIFRHIYGSSLPAAELRASTWNSVFTHDIERYRAALFDRMHELTTLITGPSGTGKELVARAIGLSRHIPFDAQRKRFADDFQECFVPINLCALSPTVIESELFGHKKGAFTGAIADRKGFLEREEPWSTVFLDELGEIDASLQLKLLRVLQTRQFQRLGDNTTRSFGGKIVAATNVNLDDEIEAGRFRADLFYRLCSDIIEVPSLHQQLCDQPQEIHSLVTLIARRLVDGHHADDLAQQAINWIDAELGQQYPWPGNIRELEQCVRNILVRKQYNPRKATVPKVTEPMVTGPMVTGPEAQMAEQILAGTLTAEQMLSRYCTFIYAREGSYEASARRLQMDRRTVKSKVDQEFLRALRALQAPKNGQ